MPENYNKALYDFVNSKIFVRVFYGKCPDCGKRIFSIDEYVDEDYQRIRARFLCSCGKKYTQTMLDFRQKPCKGYRYPQGIVTEVYDKGKKRRYIKCKNKYYLVKPDKILSKDIK